MTVQQFSALPQRFRLEVTVPERLSTENINQTCDLVSARLRYLLGQEYQRRNAVRLQQRLDARAARKAARASALDAAAQRAIAEEAADQLLLNEKQRASA